VVNDPESASAKQLLRTRIRAARRSLTPTARALAAARVCARIIAQLAAQPPDALASYLALPDELDVAAVHAWWWSRSTAARIWFPRVSGPGTLTWHALGSLGQTAVGSYGIREPDPAQVPAGELPASATLLVPGVGFTAEGLRLGQGGGFYDRLLPSHRGPTLGVGFACQRVTDIPAEAHDCRVGQVIFSD
jgi:5-formyltetrahydrofolate cyclo-ligase